MGEEVSNGSGKHPRDWTAYARIIVILFGICWVLSLGLNGCIADSNHGRDATFVMIGIMFMLTILGVPALLCAVFLPTHKVRLVLTPIILTGCLLFVSTRGSNIHYPDFLGMMPWMLAGTAISVMLPELPLMSWLYRRLCGLISR